MMFSRNLDDYNVERRMIYCRLLCASAYWGRRLHCRALNIMSSFNAHYRHSPLEDEPHIISARRLITARFYHLLAWYDE